MNGCWIAGEIIDKDIESESFTPLLRYRRSLSYRKNRDEKIFFEQAHLRRPMMLERLQEARRTELIFSFFGGGVGSS